MARITGVAVGYFALFYLMGIIIKEKQNIPLTPSPHRKYLRKNRRRKEDKRNIIVRPMAAHFVHNTPLAYGALEKFVGHSIFILYFTIFIHYFINNFSHFSLYSFLISLRRPSEGIWKGLRRRRILMNIFIFLNSGFTFSLCPLITHSREKDGRRRPAKTIGTSGSDGDSKEKEMKQQ